MITHHFERGPESWCSYDYHASMVDGGVNVFILAVWQPRGGISDSGFVWTDHRRWSADTPERPLSILPLIFYRSWVGADPLDLRGAELSVHLRGGELKLDGAQCCFWVHAHGTRWHCTAQPLPVPEGRWSPEPGRVSLVNDQAAWHCSWSVEPGNPAPLDRVLGQAESYGFSFTGFSSEVTGRLSMAEFALGPPR